MVWLPENIWLNRGLSGLSPYAAGDAAFHIFCLPRLSEHRHARHRVLAERARYHLWKARWHTLQTAVGNLQVYIFEPEGKQAKGNVLVVHGWTSEASFMTAIAEPVRRAGYRTILFDLPAHGLSEGRSTNLMNCGRATVFVAKRFAPIDAIVTHSFGSTVSLVAIEGIPPMPEGIPGVRCLAMIASPNRLSEVTHNFAQHWRLSKAGQRAFERRLERVGQRGIGAFTVATLLQASGLPALLVHARDDRRVAFRCADEIAATNSASELYACDGLGHSNILFAPPIGRKVSAYVDRALHPPS